MAMPTNKITSLLIIFMCVCMYMGPICLTVPLAFNVNLAELSSRHLPRTPKTQAERCLPSGLSRSVRVWGSRYAVLHTNQNQQPPSICPKEVMWLLNASFWGVSQNAHGAHHLGAWALRLQKEPQVTTLSSSTALALQTNIQSYKCRVHRLISFLLYHTNITYIIRAGKICCC